MFVTALVTVMSFSAAEAMLGPVGGFAMNGRSDVIRVQTLCDYRGCFGFGPRQWYRPPTYRPPGYQPPVYYRPRAAGTPRLLYQPPTTTTVPGRPASIARTPTTSSQHILYCSGKYRSYNPATNRYRTYRGLDQVCRSAYH
jgi:hypothetical protein